MDLATDLDGPVQIQTQLMRRLFSKDYADPIEPPTGCRPVSWMSLPKKGQLAVILLARLAEPLSERSLASYLFYQLRWLSPDLDPSEIPKHIGYITAVFAAAQCLTSMWWGHAADNPRLGRKRVLMIGLGGSTMSALGMGFSTSLSAAFFFRFCAGALNGNIGVLRTMVSEIVADKRPGPFFYYPCASTSVSLSDHSYESINSDVPSAVRIDQRSNQGIQEAPVKPKAKMQASFRKVVTRKVCLNMAQRFLQSLHVSAFNSILFSLLPTPKADSKDFHLPFSFTGGLGLSSEKMGLVNTTIGMIGIPLQLFVYPRLIGSLGVRSSYLVFLPLSIVAYLALPYLVLLPDNDALIWTCLSSVLTMQVLSRTFVNPATVMLVNDCAPSPNLLGTVHGLASSISSVARIMGPTVGGVVLGWGLAHSLVALPLWLLGILAGLNWCILWWIEDVDMSH